MKLKNINKEDIENMAFDDLAYEILKEKGKKIKINELFKTICELQNLKDEVYEEQIGDFFTLLATEKRFIQLSEGYWDLRENHTAEISIKELEEELEEEMEEETADIDEDDNAEVDYYDDLDDLEDDKGEDDLKDLVIVDDTFEDETEL